MQVNASGAETSTSDMGQSRHFDRGAAPSGLPRSTDIVRPPRYYGIDLANALDKFKAFTPKHHVRRVSSKPRKVSRMRLAPVAQRAITFTLVISKSSETSLGG
jgi:hypothetical protein